LGVSLTWSFFQTKIDLKRNREILDKGEISEGEIIKINCPNDIIVKLKKGETFRKEISESDCGHLSEGLTLNFKYLSKYPDEYLFMNEWNEMTLILNNFIGLGGLSMILFSLFIRLKKQPTMV
jgi:hypothetical protein